MALLQMRLEACGKGIGEPDCGVLNTVRYGCARKSPAGGFGSTTSTRVWPASASLSLSLQQMKGI